MINRRKYKDFMIIAPDGQILYGDVGSLQHFETDIRSINGKYLREIYPNLNEDYPTVRAAREGLSFPHFEYQVGGRSNGMMTKIGCAYPICQGEKPVAALEFSELVYDRDHIREIEKHAEHLIYRKNNTRYITEDIITSDETMLLIKEKIEKLALTDSTLLIYGQTGTGKELVAQALHNGGRRYARPFISVNCGALPASIIESILFGTVKGSFTGAEDKPGLFEQAEGGTLFLDEINSLDLMLQVKILKAVESKAVRRIGAVKERKVDVRIIAATNEEPHKLIKEGKMKPDLFYRLSVLYLYLPPLSERHEDILILADHFISYFNKKLNLNIKPLDSEIKNLFMSYSWPGNVRELRNAIEGAVAFVENDRITINEIPDYIVKSCMKGRNCRSLEQWKGIDLSEKSALLEKTIVQAVYEMEEGNLTRTAKRLGISKQLLHYKLQKIKESRT